MNNKINCPCGQTIEKNYNTVMVRHCPPGEYETTYYQWICNNCGQLHLEKVKPAIYL